MLIKRVLGAVPGSSILSSILSSDKVVFEKSMPVLSVSLGYQLTTSRKKEKCCSEESLQNV